MRLRRSTAVAATAAAVSGFALGASVVVPSVAGSDHDDASHQASSAAKMYTDDVFDYGVCRGVDPSCYHNWGQGYQTGDQKRVLIWSRTAGPRHAHLGTPLGPGLNPPLNANNVAQAALKSWLEAEGVQVDYTEDLAAFRPSNYQAVINLSGNRDTFDVTAQTALMQFIRAGGGFVGIHNAFGAEYDWPYYEGLLGGANYYDHGANREGTVQTLDTRDVSTASLPTTWRFTDEYYSLVPFPTYVRPLLKVDAATAAATPAGEAHADDLLVSWCHYYDGGRAWLTTLGHDVKEWDNVDGNTASDVQFRQHVVHGVLSAMGVEPFCQ